MADNSFTHLVVVGLENLISGNAVPEESSDGEVRDLDHFLEGLHRGRGVDFRSYKRPTILRRLGRRMAAPCCPGSSERPETRRTSSGSGPQGAPPARRPRGYSSPEGGAGVQVLLPLRNGGG